MTKPIYDVLYQTIKIYEYTWEFPIKLKLFKSKK